MQYSPSKSFNHEGLSSVVITKSRLKHERIFPNPARSDQIGQGIRSDSTLIMFMIARISISFALSLLIFPFNSQELFERLQFENDSAIHDLVKSVIMQYFANDRCLVLVNRINDGLSLTAEKTNLTLVRIAVENPCNNTLLVDNIVFAIDSGCRSYVILASNPKCVIRAWKEAQFSFSVPTMQRGTPKLFVVFENEDEEKSEANLDDFLSQPEAELSSNILCAIVTADREWPVTLYTNNFYERIDTENYRGKIFLNRWEMTKGFQREVDLYYDKIADLRGKKLKIAMVDMLPYGQASPFAGLEPEIVKRFCTMYNCTYETCSDEFFWGDVYSNGTGVGAIGMVFDGRADVALAAIYTWASFFNHTQYSTPYMQSGVTVILPKPEKIGGWLIPILPFSRFLWIASLLFTCAAGLSMYIATMATVKYTRFAGLVKKRGMFVTAGDTFCRSLGLLVLQQPGKPLVPTIRHLFTAIVITNLVLCTVYNAKLASFLTVPKYMTPIDTLAQLADSGTLWAAEHCAWVLSLIEVESPVIQTIVKRFQVEDIDKLGELAAQGYGIPIERLAGGHYIERDFIKEETLFKSHLMAEYLYRSPLIMMLRKASPYEERMNKLIRRVRDHGHLLGWEASTVRVYMSGRRQAALHAARKLVVEGEARQLTFSDCLGMFVLYIAGIIVSTSVFFGELVAARLRRSTTWPLWNEEFVFYH